ncbi:MAG: DEAD/DEAH box helicase [SAR324 cluster bacterium]|nr:DEAD/DEAH box helicase [SAR324 cluster bacterium]
MSHWILDSIGDNLAEAMKLADHAQVCRELYQQPFQEDEAFIQRTGDALELAVLDLIHDGIPGDEERRNDLRRYAGYAFKLFSILPPKPNPIEDAAFKLRMCSLAVLGDRGANAASLLVEYDWTDLPLETEDWKQRTWCTIVDVWLRLIRKKGWSDRDLVLERIAALRESQQVYEERYLNSQTEPKAEALKLICLYHLAKVAEILAYYITDGVVDGNYQVQQLLDTHFDRIFLACQEVQMLEIEPLSRLLSGCAAQMVENSIWTVTRAVNSRVTEFVKSLVDQGRGDKALFDVLPPQRRTLAEKGLLGSSRRAVVVSLPTSSGKTLIAQFRILQALNQFEQEKGWVAYLAPTRTLVNQITRQLRRDFAPLVISVEKVSPALEVDNIEAGLLQEQEANTGFRILVTTPEKLDLLLRQGWEARIDRPLTLVVVDEAHNIQDPTRGLKLELLLSTINNECQRAQFLLLTPFIDNASEVAKWLGGASSDDVSLSVEWQPNDRVIGIAQPEKGQRLKGKSFGYAVKMKTIHSNRSIGVEELLLFQKNDWIAKTFRDASNQMNLAAIAAQKLQERGPVIVMHQRPDWVWSLANKFVIPENKSQSASAQIKLAQEFLKLEYGPAFPLIDLLNYRVGVHHSGLSDDVRQIMEWLFEENELKFLVATTTIAQGVNFPVTSVVMASHQYPYGKDMPPEDFWNIAGCTGRIGQGKLGFVVLAAGTKDKALKLEKFIDKQAGNLNSALIEMAEKAKDWLGNFDGILFYHPEWSGFLQYLAHTYRQMGKPEDFINRVEQILRGTFGFDALRREQPELANQLLNGIFKYTDYLQRPNQPLKLVDSTGFSLNSINRVMTGAKEEKIDQNSWKSGTLFDHHDKTLQGMMGILLNVPELRKNLSEATGGKDPSGKKLSLIIKDWVNGESIPTIADRHFRKQGEDTSMAITRCGQNLYGRLTQTASWGLGALLSITGGELSEEDYSRLSNLPSQVFYGVNDDSAMVLRLLGVPRTAAQPLANSLGDVSVQPLTEVRNQLKTLNEQTWQDAIGTSEGKVYRRIWRILEGID